MFLKKLSLFVCFLSAFLVLNACDYEESTLLTNNDELEQTEKAEQNEENQEKEEKQDDEMKGENEQTEKIEKEQEKQEVKKEKPKRIKKKFDVGEQLQFKQFDVEIERMKVYTKKDRILMDIKIDWRNRAYDYGSDQMTFFVATEMQVKQGKTELVEINDAWNPENKNSSDVFFPNTLGGLWAVNLTYELVDAETPIDIIFTPTTETEGSKTVTIEIPE
mgnify:FL=1